MPAAMEGWRSSGASSKDEQESRGTPGSGAVVGGKGNEVAETPLVAAGSKRQRRPSVRLGEIGDLKVAVSKGGLSAVRWISPNFVPKKLPSGVPRGAGKLPRTRPLANVTHRGETGQVVGSVKVGSDDVVRTPAAAAAAAAEITARDDVVKAAEGAEAGEAPPSSSEGGSYGTATMSPTYSARRRGKPGKRKRAANVRSSTFAKSVGVVPFSRKAKELQEVGYKGELAPASAPAASNADISELPVEFAELSGTQADMEDDSGSGRRVPGNTHINNNNEENSEEEHTQNGDTEVLEGDNGHDEDFSGRQEEDEPVTSNQIMNTSGALDAPDDYLVPKNNHRDQGTSRLGDGEKEHKKTQPSRDASMKRRRGGALGRVRSWLNSLGLDKYSDIFEENEVDDGVLHMLTFEDLKEMGVVAVGARRKMFAAIQELGSAQASR